MRAGKVAELRQHRVGRLVAQRRHHRRAVAIDHIGHFRRLHILRTGAHGLFDQACGLIDIGLRVDAGSHLDASGSECCGHGAVYQAFRRGSSLPAASRA